MDASLAEDKSGIWSTDEWFSIVAMWQSCQLKKGACSPYLEHYFYEMLHLYIFW